MQQSKMWKNKIVWLMWLIGVSALYLFGNNIGTLVVLLLSVIIPVLLAIAAGVSARYTAAELVIPEMVDKGKPVSGILKVTNTGMLPLQRTEFCIVCENRLTGEKIRRIIIISCGPKSDAKETVKLSSKHCGVIDITVAEARVTDAFGITSWNIRGFERKHVVVSPGCFDMEITLIEDINTVVDSDEYSMTRPGSDPSETFAIREYVPGDSIKSIHWKLSQKFDRPMVRELGLPVVDRLLVLLETSVIPGIDLPAVDTADIMAEAFFSVSRELVRQGISHALGWKNMETGLYEEYNIKTAEDISAIIEHILSNTVGPGNATIAACFRRSYAQCAYAHVIVVTPYIEPDITALYNGNRVTALLAGGAPESDGMRPDGVYVLSFVEENYKRDLSKLEL